MTPVTHICGMIIAFSGEGDLRSGGRQWVDKWRGATDPKGTSEILSQKISLTKIDSVGRDARGAVVGWESAPPREGERYTVYLGNGRLLRTSTVEDVRDTLGAFLVKTANSIYRVEYLKK